jgi:hypothetical protein
VNKGKRKNHFYKSGQSVVEYVIIFAIVAVLSVFLVQKMPDIFKNYVTNATEKMK